VRRDSDSAPTLPSRLRWYLLATYVVGVPVVAGAAVTAARSHPSPRSIVGILMFFGFAVFSEWRPVPIDPAGRRLVSLAFVFIIASQLLFGWEWSVLTGATAIALTMAFAREAFFKVLFNGSTYAIAASLAALPSLAFGHVSEEAYEQIAGSVFASGAIFVFANVMLVCIAIGLASGASTFAVFRDHLRYSGTIFGIMIFVAVQAVIFWRLSAPLVILLSAPLFALTLYQRSSVRHRAAEEAATTDSLTGLKNRRAFEEDAAAALAANQRGSLSLCLIDIDDFKSVNDRHGHLSGDAVLEAVARSIEQTAPGRGYRLGGDEFALLIRRSGDDAATIAASLRHAFALNHRDLLPEPVTLSAGIALYPDQVATPQPHSLLAAMLASSLRSPFDSSMWPTSGSPRSRSAAYDRPLVELST